MSRKLVRYPVYLFAIISVLLGCWWLFFLAAPKGWGGRSTLQIVLFSTLLVVIPAAISMAFGFRAILAARERQSAKAFASVIVGIVAVPVAWFLTIYGHAMRWLPF